MYKMAFALYLVFTNKLHTTNCQLHAPISI